MGWVPTDVDLFLNPLLAELGQMLDDLDCSCQDDCGYPPMVQLIHGEQFGQWLIKMHHEPNCGAVAELRNY